MRNGEVSYWWHALGGFPSRRASLPGPLEADVCIVGGGYTGLWTAYYLAERRPDARIVVLEAAFAGYGASGRNGGWVTSEMPGSRAIYARGPGGAAGVRALEAELRSTVDEVGRVCEAESIDCDYVRGGGGEVPAARTNARGETGTTCTRSCPGTRPASGSTWRARSAGCTRRPARGCSRLR